MPLVLSLKENDAFIVSKKEKFTVAAIQSRLRFTLRNEGTGELFEISDERSTEVLENVTISAGDHAPSSSVRAVIEAPKAISIIRADVDPKHKAKEAVH